MQEFYYQKKSKAKKLVSEKLGKCIVEKGESATYYEATNSKVRASISNKKFPEVGYIVYIFGG